MRIASVEVFLLYERFVWIKVSSDEGPCGWGTAAFHGGMSTARLAARLGDSIVGEDPLATEALWHRLFRTGYRLGSTGVHMAALSGLDIALWDLKGRALSMPIHMLLGGRIRDRFPVYSSLMKRGLPSAEVVQRVRRRIEQGYRAVKLHTATLWGLGEGRDDTIELVTAIREACGGRASVEIIIDVNHAYDPAMALRVGRQLEQLDVTWLEEPIAPWDHAGYDRLQTALDLPIAAGEQGYDLWQFRDLVTVAHVDVLQPNITSCGGFTQGRKVAALAEAWNVPLHFHNTDPTLTTAAQLHLWSVSPMCVGVQEYYGEDDHPLRESDPPLIQRLPVVDGHLQVPTGPGLGIEVDEEAVTRVATRVSA